MGVAAFRSPALRVEIAYRRIHLVGCTADRGCPVFARRSRVESLRYIICARSSCRRPFALCAQCDRGHRYCSSRCRDEARRASLRAAGRRHQQTREGRLDHADRQRRYRERVTHQSEEKLTGSISGTSRRTWRPEVHFDAHRPTCTICGHSSAFLRFVTVSAARRSRAPP